jgi:hypothetical protein
VKRKLQVFVSSTFSDLIEERQAAVAAILKAWHIPAGMELFTAGDVSQMKTIERWINESDVYMLILGGRYGSIEGAFQRERCWKGNRASGARRQRAKSREQTKEGECAP